MIYKQLKKNGLRLPALGQGVGLYAWNDSHIDTMREGVDLGMNFFDTAEGTTTAIRSGSSAGRSGASGTR